MKYRGLNSLLGLENVDRNAIFMYLKSLLLERKGQSCWLAKGPVPVDSYDDLDNARRIATQHKAL